MQDLTIQLSDELSQRLRTFAQDRQVSLEVAVQAVLVNYFEHEDAPPALNLLQIAPISLGAWHGTPNFIEREDFYDV
jgi:hypothetical protein